MNTFSVPELSHFLLYQNYHHLNWLTCLNWIVKFQISSEALDNIRTVAALNKEDRFERTFNDHFDEAYKYDTTILKKKQQTKNVTLSVQNKKLIEIWNIVKNLIRFHVKLITLLYRF